jgi:hypothetical protein
MNSHLYAIKKEQRERSRSLFNPNDIEHRLHPLNRNKTEILRYIEKILQYWRETEDDYHVTDPDLEAIRQQCKTPADYDQLCKYLIIKWHRSGKDPLIFEFLGLINPDIYDNQDYCSLINDDTLTYE